MPRSITATFDYRCPFAYNGHAALVAAVRGGADLDVRYAPFSLDQVHVPEGEPPMWERDPTEWGTGMLALCFGIAARDHFADRFLDVHLELFAARHEHGHKLTDVERLREAVARGGVDPDELERLARQPETLATLAREHTEMVERYAVFGVPTFIEGEEAVFVRLMERGNVEHLLRVLDLLPWTGLNELKRTTIPR